MKRIMGLDASTTTIGRSILDYNEQENTIKFVDVIYFKPPKKVDIYEKLDVVESFITKELNQCNPTDIALEEFLLFMKGKSSAQTITSLAVLNRTVGFTCWKWAKQNQNNSKVHMLYPASVRSCIKVNGKAPPKEDVPDVVANILGIEFPWITSKRVKKNNGRIEENYDMADSIAVALACIKKSQEKKKGAKK